MYVLLSLSSVGHPVSTLGTFSKTEQAPETVFEVQVLAVFPRDFWAA